MMEHTTDRLFWTLTSVIVGALILTIGIKAFPNTTQSIFQPISGVMKQADSTTKNADMVAKAVINEQGVPKKASTLGYSISDNGDGTATITNYNPDYGKDVNIPPYILDDNGKKLKVTTIAKWAFAYDNGKNDWNDQLTSVYLPDTIAYIGDQAFENSPLTSLRLSQNLQHVGNGAFQNWAGSNNTIESVVLPKSITYLGDWAFAEWPHLKSVGKPVNVANQSNTFRIRDTGNAANDYPHVYDIH